MLMSQFCEPSLTKTANSANENVPLWCIPRHTLLVTDDEYQVEEEEKVEHADVTVRIGLGILAVNRTVNFLFALVQIQNPQEAFLYSSPWLSPVASPVYPGHCMPLPLEVQKGQEEGHSIP